MWIKPLFIFWRFLKKVSIMFRNFLVTMVPLKKWHEFKTECNINGSSYFNWVQLVDSISERWKFIIKENYENATNLIIHDHQLNKDSRVITLGKVTPTEMYSILISKVQDKPSSNACFENLFNDYNIDWTAIYMLPRHVMYDSYMWFFQYEILNNFLFLNKKVFTFGIKPSLLCSFCNLYDETPCYTYSMNVTLLNICGWN